jgi:hypothetical protein
VPAASAAIVFGIPRASAMQTTGRRLRDHSEDMSDDNQTVIARSFIELFIPAGAVKPRETQVVVAERYGLCEDMAQMLTEHARSKLWELGVPIRS